MRIVAETIPMASIILTTEDVLECFRIDLRDKCIDAFSSGHRTFIK